jgi:FkbM family methyltransferase
VDAELKTIESIQISKFRRILNQTLQKFDIAIMKYRTYYLLIENSKNFRRLQEIDTSEISLDLFDFLVKKCGDSNSQLFQDLIIIYLCDNYLINRGNSLTKVFVEFGACDGVKFSNSFLLEQNGWQGVVAEPARRWHKELNTNRKCAISFNAVSNKTGESVAFIETIEGEFSSLASSAESDQFSDYRRNNTANRYLVKTISLNDLVEKNGFQNEITYLSIDTEGGESKILESFDFSKYNPAIITVEHNYSREQKYLDDLLLKFGYEKVLTTLSKFENWYIKSNRFEIPADGKF